MLCPKCDTKMEDDHNYCSKCGYKREPPKPEPEQPKKTSEEQSVTLLLALFLIICLVVVFLTGNFPSPI